MKDFVNLCSLIQQFGNEDRSRAYLEALRWPDEILCPRCRSDKITQIVKRNQYDCDACRYQFSLPAATVFNDSHLPLWKWFLCTYLVTWYPKAMNQTDTNGRKHETINHSAEVYVDGGPRRV